MAHSPWGRIEYSTVYAPGFKRVGTCTHGGIMTSEAFAEKHLSKAARDRAIVVNYGSSRRTVRVYYCYKWDAAYAIPFYELLDLFGEKMYADWMPDNPCGWRDEARDWLLKTLAAWEPDYLAERGITGEILLAERKAEA